MIVDEEHFLEHYGVKGMRWGERKAARSNNRALNKQARIKEKEKQKVEFEKQRKALRPSSAKKTYPNTPEGRKAARKDRVADIDRARARVATGALRADSKEAKQKYKADKVKIGSREARKILKKKRAALYADIDRANEIRDGAEVVRELISAWQNQRGGW